MKKKSMLQLMIEAMLAPPPPKSKNQIRREEKGLDPGRAMAVVPRRGKNMIEDRVALERRSNAAVNASRPGYCKLTTNPKKLRSAIRRQLIAA